MFGSILVLRIVFKKIPKVAVLFYCIGFLTILVAMYLFFKQPRFMSADNDQLILMQQVFIAGAIIVALGSVINNIYQFKRKQKPEVSKDQ